jgi:hypothetical protein
MVRIQEQIIVDVLGIALTGYIKGPTAGGSRGKKPVRRGAGQVPTGGVARCGKAASEACLRIAL